MRRSRPAAAVALLTSGFAAGGLTGCAADDASGLRGDLIRTQDTLARTRIELRDAKADLAAAERSAQTLRTRLAEDGLVVAEAPEQARALGRITQLTVSKLLTGGLDRDDKPGDEILAVTLAPADAAGEAVKAPGAVTLELVNLAAPHGDRQVGRWTFDAAEAADAWRSTAVATGFRFRLPLEPRATRANGPEELHLVAIFETSDGRRFDATHPVRVNRPRGAAPPPAPAPAPAPVPFPQDLPPAGSTGDPFAPPPPTFDPAATDPFAPDPFPMEPAPSNAAPADESPPVSPGDGPPQIAVEPADPFARGEDPFAEF